MNIPNCLSSLRILILPFFIYFFLKGDWTAVAVFLIVSGLSDFLDGLIARKFNQITELGKILDPVADKMTQASVAVCMAYHFRHVTILIILLSLFVVKEATMLLGTILLFRKGMRPTPARWYGKLATGCFYFSMILIIFLEAFDYQNMTLTIVLTVLSAALMIYAFVRYTFVFRSLSHGGSREEEPERTADKTAV